MSRNPIVWCLRRGAPLAIFTLVCIGSVQWLSSGVFRIVDAQSESQVYASFDDSMKGWAANKGKLRLVEASGSSGQALEWEYRLDDEAIYVTSDKDLGRFKGTSSVSLKIRSDRAGRLAIRFDEKDGEAFYTMFDVGTSWTNIQLSNDEISHVNGQRDLNPDKLKRIYIVDVSGQDEGWEGERTVWIDEIASGGAGAAVARGEPGAAPVTPESSEVYASFDDSTKGWAANKGKLRLVEASGSSGQALEWEYRLDDEAIYVTSDKDLGRFKGTSSVSLKIRSDRAGRLAIRFDEKDGEAFYTMFDVGTSWTNIQLSNDEISHVNGQRDLNPDELKRIYIVDVSGQDEGWEGERTVWIDEIASGGARAAVARGEPGAAPVTPESSEVYASFDDSTKGWAANKGKLRLVEASGSSGQALEWEYRLDDEAIYLTSDKDLGRFKGTSSVSLKIRSDRAGRLAIRFDEKDDEAFYTMFDVGTSWTNIQLSNDEISHVNGQRDLNPDKLKRFYIVDVSGQDEGWEGERTVWIDEVRAGPMPSATTAETTSVSSGAVTDLEVPQHRSFYMGMTPWPYDLTLKAVQETYEFLEEHTDIVAHHFDDGVPWPEAYDGKEYPEKVRENIDYRVAQLRGHKVYLTLSPIGISRDGLAGYWNAESNMERPGKWKSRDFDDQEILDAYVNYCEKMIDTFQPTLLNYGIEVNMLEDRNPRAFEKYKEMTAKVYPRLKKKYPDLPMFLSLHIETFAEAPARQKEAIRALLPYTDYIAVSSYPYGGSNGRGGTYADPSTLPANWFQQMADLAPDKPFAVAETGFQAEDFVSKKYPHVPGKESWQAEYARRLFSEASSRQARLVVWFVPRDYDPFWVRLEKMGLDEVFKTWRDTGLLDENGRRRPALDVWDSWLAAQRR